MILANLIIPLTVINAAVLIAVILFLIPPATESVDLVKDLSPVLRLLLKRALKFRVKQQIEETAIKTFIITVACISIILLTAHSIMNVITAKSNHLCGKMALIRSFFEHTTSLIRVFFCLLGCYIFTAIVASDLTICMPTPTYRFINPYIKFAKAHSWFLYAGPSSYIPGTFLPKESSIQLTKRYARQVSETEYGDITICEYCDNLYTSGNAENDAHYVVCKKLWESGQVLKYPSGNNMYQNYDEITAVTYDAEVILSCDSGKSYVSLGFLQSEVESSEVKSNRRVKRLDYIYQETDIYDYYEDEPKYDNVLIETKQGHSEACKRMQDLLPNALFLMAIALTCMSVILLLSRYERDVCKCGHRKIHCVCEIKICSCRARGAGLSPSEINASAQLSSKDGSSKYREGFLMPKNRKLVSSNYKMDILCAPVIFSETEIEIHNKKYEK